MAYNADKEIVELIGSFDKDSRGNKIEVKKMSSKTSSRVQVDIRTMYTDEDGVVRPTTKGCRFSIEKLTNMVGLLASMLDDTEKEDLVRSLGYAISTEDLEEGRGLN